MSYQPLIELETVGSTNDYARDLARQGAAAGTVVWAHEQTAGRGRQGNSWVGLPGNLFMTMIVRPEVNTAQLGQLSLLSGVALANVLEKLMPPSDLRLKWPNDLYLNGKKLAGILVETESAQKPWAVIGVGVNIVDAPEGAASLAGTGLAAKQVLERLAVEITALIAQWEKSGFVSIRANWMKRAWKLGEQINARLPKETLTGIFDGLDDTGALLLTVNGRQQVINTGEVFAA